MKQEGFKEYYRNEVRQGKILPVIPKEKWENVEEYLLYLRHLAAYVFTKGFVVDKSVLEIGSGTGYGASYLSKFALNVIAVDIWREAILYCKDKYGKDNLTFFPADGLKLPFKPGSFDVVVSFQVIEHIEPKNVLTVLSEMGRVLKREGILILSTPNSKLRLLPFQKPWNPEHKKEYDCRGLRNLLSKVFEEVKVYGLCGSEEILSIEYNRVMQNPYHFYLKPLIKLLHYALPPSIKHQLGKIARYLPKYRTRENYNLILQDFTSKFSVTDFKIDANCPQDCLDLIAICTRVHK